jgi:hypothetical protein
MHGRYILDGKVPVPCDDLLQWGRWLQTADRTVALTGIGDMQVSTVFLGLDHSFGYGPALLFETMIFGGRYADSARPADYQERCSTWEEAEAQHAKAVEHAKAQHAKAVEHATSHLPWWHRVWRGSLGRLRKRLGRP